jgi:formylglycine-generating enzyme required for sulfatase activity
MKQILPTTIVSLAFSFAVTPAKEPAQGDTQRLDLGGVTLDVDYIPPGKFMMGSTPNEQAWATGIEGGAQPETTRESFEGEQPRLTRVKNGFWMGRTEVSVGQFRQFVEDSGFVTDAEKPAGETQVFDPGWDGYHLTTQVTHPWKSVKGKSWRDPNWGFPNRDDFPVVCVSYNDMKEFCQWLTQRERNAGRLPEDQEYRLPTEAEWEYACRHLRRVDISGGETRSRTARAG